MFYHKNYFASVLDTFNYRSSFVLHIFQLQCEKMSISDIGRYVSDIVAHLFVDIFC